MRIADWATHISPQVSWRKRARLTARTRSSVPMRPTRLRSKSCCRAFSDLGRVEEWHGLSDGLVLSGVDLADPGAPLPERLGTFTLLGRLGQSKSGIVLEA